MCRREAVEDAESCAESRAKSWPFVEARKIVSRLEKNKKKEVILETGYGPSGLPHIGTFGEVLRTTFVMQAFRRLSSVPTKLFVFSDDMDGLRKVPTNVPNQEILAAHIDMPLTSVPDPFGKYESFAHHNNAMLQQFLDSFGFEYEFKSSTVLYKSGVFNESLVKVLEHYDEIMSIMLPSLREERQKTYSPFLPVCKRSGKVLQVPIESVNLANKSVTYHDPDTKKLVETSILDGNCKLQWKADWGMRWAALGVDYEMNGKDLIDSYKLSSRICRAIGSAPPENLTYELFLDEEGKKISKSKGNGLSMDEWLRYAPTESLAYYMFQTPTRAKRLYFDVIPNAVDDYIDALEKSDASDCDSHAYHIHNGVPPAYPGCPRFSMLLNLVQACNTSDEDVLMDFVRKYAKQMPEKTAEFTRRMVKFAIKYYNDFVANKRQFVRPSGSQSDALMALKNELADAEDADTDELQTLVFEIGKRFFPGDARGWFTTLYGVLFGAESGPKMGSFISLYGVSNTINLIERRMNIGTK